MTRSQEKKPKVKGVSGTVPFKPEYTLVDLSLNTRGDQEDKEFAEDPVIRLNLRRGNTVAVVIEEIVGGKYVDPMNIVTEKNRPYEITRVQWVRKGLRKFFDMCLPYVQQASTQNLDGLGSFDGNFPKVYRGRDEYMEELRKVIFFEPEQSMLKDRARIDVYKTNKANGENAQVSYCAELEAWIIASKNVSLAARFPEELEQYSQTRYSFATLIAQEWFRLISPLSPARLLALKAALTNHTIVGEYVGHPDHQHLVRYTSKDILFYAYVDHNSDYTCLPPAQAFALFREFGLSHVKAQLYGSYGRPTELYAALESLFMQTSKEDINEGEEGSVLYFVRDERPDRQDFKEFRRQVLAGEEVSCSEEIQREAFSTQHTLSLAKLKTLEYRLYRKLREKLKHFSDNKSVDDVLRTYKREVRELIEGQELPRPLDFYYEVASVALTFISRNPTAQDKLQDHYIDFLDKIIAGVQDGSIDLKAEASQDSVEIVLITPPTVLPNDQIRTLAEELNYEYKRVKEWNENHQPKEKSLFHLIHAQKLSARFDKKALIVHVGFGETGKRECLAGLGRLRAAGTRVEDEEIGRLIAEGDLEARVEKLWEDVNSREQQLLHVYEHHILVLASLEGAVAAIQHSLSVLSSPSVPPEVLPPPSPVQTASPALASKPSASDSKRVLVIIPMGVPGMGKTYLVKQLQDEAVSLGCSFSIVSSDQVRRSCMDDHMARNHSKDLDKAFEATAKKARDMFFERVKEGLRSTKQVHVLFMDKNHPPNAISGTLKELEKMKPKGVSKLELIALVPECSQKFHIPRGNGHIDYELSFTFLVQCLKRTIARQNHETLVGSEAKKAAVVLMMFAMYKDVHFADFLRGGFDHILRVPFTDENKVHYPEPLVDNISDLLANLKTGSMPAESDAQQIVTDLSHIPDIFSAVSNLASTLSSLSDIIRRSGRVLPEVQVAEPMQVDIPAPKRAEPLNLKQMPVYLGIDVELWFGPGLLGFLRSCLFTLTRTYMRDEDLKRDYDDIMSNFYASGYQSGLPICEQWQYPKSLHLTTKFIGGGRNKQAANDPTVRGFRVNEEVSLCARLFAYVPQRIMCVLCDVMTSDIAVENKFPHVTCLLGRWQAKCSNDVLNGISFEAEVNKQRANICGEDVQVYTIRLQPEWVVKGLTKAFF